MAATAEPATATTTTALASTTTRTACTSTTSLTSRYDEVKALPDLFRSRRKYNCSSIATSTSYSSDAAVSAVATLPSISTATVTANAGARIAARLTLAALPSRTSRPTPTSRLATGIKSDEPRPLNSSDVKLHDAAPLACAAGRTRPARPSSATSAASIAGACLAKALARGASSSLPGGSLCRFGKATDYDLALNLNLISRENEIAAIECVLLVLRLIK
jgi:hypothetical protein